MKYRAVTTLATLFVSLVAVSAHAQATSTTINLAGQVFVEPGDPTCPQGTFGTDTFTYDNGFEHVLIKPDGSIHLNGTGEGEWEQQPYLDPSVPTCTGHFAFWCGELVASDGVTVLDDQFTVDMDATCTNGSTIHTHWTGKLQTVDGVQHKLTGTFTCH